MTTTTMPVFSNTHKPPVMFCAPGNPDDILYSFENYGEGIDSVVRWARGSHIRIATLSQDTISSWVLDIIKAVVEEWMTETIGGLTYEWVSGNRHSEIRISFFNNVPSWSCLGPRATLYDQSQPTMNFNFGGWKDKRVVYSHRDVKRLAAHLFGHALGLPHAQQRVASSFNEKALQTMLGCYYAGTISSATGCGHLRNAQSIMGYEVPAALTKNGTDLLQDSSVIDKEAHGLVRSLYWTPVPYLNRCDISDSPGFDRAPARPSFGKRRFFVTQTRNIVTGLRTVHMDMNSDFIIHSRLTGVWSRQGYEWEAGSQETGLINATYNILSFEEDDERVRTGDHVWNPTVGEQKASHRLNFSKPFVEIPKVVVFITGFHTAKGANIRIDVSASKIDREGFTIDMMTWADTHVYFVSASWLAHEPGEETIRSGKVVHPFNPSMTRLVDVEDHYSIRMNKRPSNMFIAYSHIDANPTADIRLNLSTGFNEDGISVTFSTWEEDSKFVLCAASYVVLF
ncbi:hypothetical protein NW768_000971 [Fusarium equiseti]|uniref:H-type lectin domain-containing protein n=1 Tax=Fusarium equiseti TaxID=61235 RepID=A0ABQ8RUC3_FUSEQ|nr:hypothetical protein NW768_000971 [Fusarium equiseti]